MQTSSPTVWRRWLAFELKRMRQLAGLSQAGVAKAIGSQVPKVSLIEGGQRNVQTRDLETLLRLFEVPEDRWEEYFTAAENAHKKGWWETYDEHTMPGWMGLFVGLEQGAQRLRIYEPAVFPGLLQTPEYATAILQHFGRDRSQAAIERLVELRIRRQEALWRHEDPLRMWAVVDEGALHRMVGGRELMRAQLAHAADVVRHHENISFQVVPFDSAGTLDASYGAFAILHFGWPTDPGVVYLEHPWNAEFLDSLADVEGYSVLFERLRGLARPPDESIDMLELSAKEFAA